MAQNDSRLRRSMDLSPCSRSSVRKNTFLRPEGESASKLDERDKWVLRFKIEVRVGRPETVVGLGKGFLIDLVKLLIFHHVFDAAIERGCDILESASGRRVCKDSGGSLAGESHRVGEGDISLVLVADDEEEERATVSGYSLHKRDNDEFRQDFYGEGFHFGSDFDLFRFHNVLGF